jgi:peptide/nickel transport system substrate-binding protein
MRANRGCIVVLLAAACSRGHAHPEGAIDASPAQPSCGPPLPAPQFDRAGTPLAPTPPSDRPMVVELDAEPATLLPLVHPDWQSWFIEGHLVLESLVRLDPVTGSLVGELAESWQVDPSGTRWTFHVRKGVKWHDGVAATADDVLFTFDRLLDPSVGAPDRAFFAGAHVSRVGPADIEVKLTSASPAAALAFDHVLILPRHRFPRGDLSRSEDASAPVGTGPMRLSSWVRGREIVLVRNASYWGPEAPLPTLTFRFITSRPALLSAIDHGDVDVVPRASVEIAEHAEQDPSLSASYEVVRAGGFDYTAWIQNVDSPKLKDPRVRRAIGLTIPRGQIRSEVERCGVQLATGPLPPGHEALAGVEPPRFDPAEAARLFDEAGVVDKNGDGIRDWAGAPARFTLLYPASSRQQERAATVIADELRRLGVTLELMPVEWAEFLSHVEAHDFELAAIEWSIDGEPDLYPLFHSSQAGGGLNYGSYASQEVDGWLDQLRTDMPRENRTEILHRIVLRLRGDEAYTFLFSPLQQAVVKRGALGVVPTALGWQPRSWGWRAGQPALDK